MPTSTKIKQKYIDKEYKPWSIRLKKSDYKKIEEVRERIGVSRADLLKMLVAEKYGIIFEANKEFKKRKKQYNVVRKNLEEVKNIFKYYNCKGYDDLKEAEVAYFKYTYNIDDSNIYTELYDGEKLIESNRDVVLKNYKEKFLGEN